MADEAADFCYKICSGCNIDCFETTSIEIKRDKTNWFLPWYAYLWKIGMLTATILEWMASYIYNLYHWMHSFGVVNRSKLATNNLLSNKSLKIQDSCLLGLLILAKQTDFSSDI